MKTISFLLQILLLQILLLPNRAFAESECRIIEFTDHYEASCTGTTDTPAVAGPIQAILPPAPAPVTTAETYYLEEPGPVIRSDLSKRLGAYWLKTLPH